MKRLLFRKKEFANKRIAKILFTIFILQILLLTLLLSGCGKSENSGDVVDAFVRDSKIEMDGALKGTNDVSIVKSVELSTKINEMINDKDHYPHIVGISVNDDGSLFEVSFDSKDLTVQESTLRMSLYMVGADFQANAGLKEFVQVDYIDKTTGEVFATGNSDEVQLTN